MRTEEIIAGFAKAGLTAVPMKRPMFPGAQAKAAFFLVTRKARNKVWYEFWPGSDKNRVQVLNTNSEVRQLILLVKEAGGKLTIRQYNRETHRMEPVTQKIPPQTRRFLVGFDERDLFMSQLPASARITTVEQAHDVLRTPGLSEKVERQGEWFFEPVTKEERDEIDRLKLAIQKKARIGGAGRGKPHTAEEYIKFRGIDGKMFVKGKVRHLDHETVEFSTWHRVVRNTEDRSANARWID